MKNIGIDIDNLKSSTEYNQAIVIIDNIIMNLDDLESYYLKLGFYEDYDNVSNEKEWWQNKKDDLEKELEEYMEDENRFKKQEEEFYYISNMKAWDNERI